MVGRIGFYFTHYLILYRVVDSARSGSLRSLLRAYGFQQSVCGFEVETTPCGFECLKEKVLDIIDVREDCVIFYPLSKHSIFSKEVFGRLKYRVSRIF